MQGEFYMSGIYGILNKQYDQPTTETCLKYLSSWNKAYGNNTINSYFSPNLGIGISTEHITNTPVNQTPIISENNVTAVIDAIIYNRNDLTSKYNLSSSYSDEELLFALITKYGLDELRHVNGDFAGVLYDSQAKTLVLFTDHMGIRPLYYYKSDSCISFSTDIRGLIALPDISADINPEYLFNMINGYTTTSHNQTEYSDIYIVTPATYITIDISKDIYSYSEKSYWKLGSHKIKYLSNKKYISKMRELISGSIRKRLEVFPGLIGAELSGGLDSGAIDILINRFGRKAVFYSWSFDTNDVPIVPNDERLIIQDICDHENISCNYRRKKYNYMDSNLYKSHKEAGLSINPNSNFVDNCALPLFIDTPALSQTAQFISESGSNVVFTGHGGDEGVSHRADSYELLYNKEYFHCLKCLYDQTKGQSNRLIKTIKQFRYKKARGYSYQNDPYKSYLNAPDILRQDFKDKYSDYKATPFYFPFDAISYINSGATQVRIRVATLFGAYSGARYIFPYLDYEVIDYAVSIPRHMYIKNNQNRYIFRQAFKDIFPKSLYELTSKISPSTDVPVDEEDEQDNGKDKDWFEELKKSAEYLCNRIDRDFWGRFLDFDVIDKLKESDMPTTNEDIMHYQNVLSLLSKCYQFQNTVKKIKNL
jgi:asparagine synthase (glutamine-hydrolysing)